MIQLAGPRMLPALKTIWEACFGDPGFYADFVFSRLARPEQVLVSTGVLGEPVAMLCMQPFWLSTPQEGRRCRCVYIYGVATLPRCRGRGISTALLEGAHRHIASSGGAASVLVPADEGLFDFYRKRGYEKAFPLRRVVLSGGEMPPPGKPCVLTSAALEQLEKLRDRFFLDSRMFVRWGRGYLEAIGAECRLGGGEVLRFACGGEEGYAVCCRRGDEILLKEIAASDEALPHLLAAVHRRFGAAAYRLYLRGDRGGDFLGHVLPFGLIRWYDRERMGRFSGVTGAPAYLAHVLD